MISLTLSLPPSSINDLAFSVFPSIFFKLSYKISLLKNGFVTLFLIRFSKNFQKITLNSSRIKRCKICALTLVFSYPKRVKKTKSSVAENKIAKFSARDNYLKIKLRLYVYQENKAFIINTV